MQVRVTGKQIDIGGALPLRARARMEIAIAKYFDGGADASVVFSHEGTLFRSDCTVHLDSGVVLKAAGNGNNAYKAFDEALGRVETRIRRYMRKLRNHHDRGTPRRRAVS